MKDEWHSETRNFTTTVTDEVTEKSTGVKRQRKTSCGNFYLTVVLNDDGTVRKVLPTMGKAGTCLNHWITLSFNLMNEVLKHKDGLQKIVECAGGDFALTCSSLGNPYVDEVKSCSQGIVQMLKHYLPKEEEK